MAAEDYCDLLMQKIKASNLHYRVSENPFSLQIMLRKKFIDDQIPSYKSENFESKFKQLEDRLAVKTNECEIRQSEAKNLKEELAKVSEELHETKVELMKTHSNTKHEKSKLHKELKTIKIAAEKKEAEFEQDLKHAKDVIEKKEIRIQEVINANKNLYKQINAARVEAKTSSTSTSSIQASNIVPSLSSYTSLLTTSSKSTNTDSDTKLSDTPTTSNIQYSSPSTLNSDGSYSSNKPQFTNSVRGQDTGRG